MPAKPLTFDPDGDLVLVLSKAAKTTNAASQNAAKGAAGQSSNKRKRGSPTQSVPVTEPEKVRMIVSSKHMILASPVFKAMLQPGRFREGLERNAAGQMEVDLPEDDQDIMVIVLNLIHGRNRLVPKHVDLEMLTRLAILVDKYQMVEVVESFSDTWIDNLLAKDKLPGGYSPSMKQKQSIQRWMAISWVFRRQKEFSKITSAAMICCGANLADELNAELPIPQKIIEMIGRKRETNMSSMFGIIKEAIERYKGSKTICPSKRNGFACDAMILGCLIKGLSAAGIWPIPEPPYEDITFSQLVSHIEGLEIESLCDKMDPDSSYQPSKRGHRLLSSFLDKVDSIEEKLTGLDIKTFQR